MFNSSSMLRPLQSREVHLDPVKFYAICDVIRGFDPVILGLDTVIPTLDTACNTADDEVDDLAKVIRSIDIEQKRNTRRNKNPFNMNDEVDSDPFSAIRSAAPGENFLQVFFDIISALQIGFRGMRDMVRGIRPESLVMTERRTSQLVNVSGEKLQQLMFEISMNEPVVHRFTQNVLSAEGAREFVVQLSNALTTMLDRYHQMLSHRHTVEGVQIHGNSPVTTDVALTIFENVDASGEIQDGLDPNEISAYSAHKAEIVASAAKTGLVGDFVSQPGHLIEFVKDRLAELQGLALTVENLTAPIVNKLRVIIGPQLRKRRVMSTGEFASALHYLDILNPQEITYREKTGLLTAEERFALNFKNETLKQVCARLSDEGTSVSSLVKYILRRKAELRDYYRDENSFYVCKISAGNPFGGQAPGELEVIPGTRPIVNMDEVIGSGFEEIKNFIGQVETASKWHEIFLATSPSRTADKSNVLMVGPMGCGKSEVLRAVGGDKKSIGLFAVGSDFLTCWKGESEKNPKRLFEAANKLQREGKKHVHILIDEIDSVLNGDRGHESFGGSNLVTEFQNLMDGVVHYPNLSIWGATNNVERIPMPMIRRFSKVIVVGELDQDDRIKLLKSFASFMPLDDIKDRYWNEFATSLEGATGDVIRKVIDYVWRDKMTWFVKNYQPEAEKVRDYLASVQGQKFTLADFTAEQRMGLHDRLKSRVRVHFSDIENSIAIHLDNVAVHHEIQTAKLTYERSKAFLAHLREGRGQKKGDKKRNVELEHD